MVFFVAGKNGCNFNTLKYNNVITNILSQPIMYEMLNLDFKAMEKYLKTLKKDSE